MQFVKVWVYSVLGMWRVPVMSAFTFLAMNGVFLGCKEPKTAEQAAAYAAYQAELLACVSKAPTLAESKTCRASVDAKWGVTK